MNVSVEMQAILLSLEPLFQEADKKGLLFFHWSREAGEIWCSPEYLRRKQSQGEYVWAPEHWELRSPTSYMKNLRAQAESIVLEFNALAKRFGQGTTLTLTEMESISKFEEPG